MIKKRMKITFICFLLGCMLITACRKNDKENQDNTQGNTIETTVSPTATPTEAPEDTAEDTGESDTQDTKEQTETESISEKDALKLIQDITGERGYYFDLLDDHLNVGDSTYYIYLINDGSGPIEPNVLVDKVSGELLCYYQDGNTAPFSEHPLYTEPDTGEASQTAGKEDFTREDALAQLTKISSQDLGLPAELKEYKIMFDDWTSNIKGNECYGINVYSDKGEQMINMGRFYVATDGSVMYRFDSQLDDLIEIKAE